jgi:hypothetical protein
MNIGGVPIKAIIPLCGKKSMSFCKNRTMKNDKIHK